MTTEKQDTDLGDDEPTNSANAYFLLEIASILAVATTNVIELGQCLSISNSQVVEINTSLEDPKNKILHLLEKFRDHHGNKWQSELESVARDRLNNPNLASKISSVKPIATITTTTTDTPAAPKPTTPVTHLDESVTNQSQKRYSQSSEWEVTSGNTSFGQSDQHDDRSSESFERLSEENVFVLRDGDQLAKDEEHHASFDQPEMSIQIAKVGEALKVVSDLLGNVEGINLLPEIVPQILKLVRQMKSQKMLRLVFEEENSNLKLDLQRANEIIRDLRESVDKLEAEVADLKKATEDKSLRDFDYVTRKEAQEMKEQQKQEEEKQTTSAPTINSPSSSTQEGVSIEAYEALQKKIISLKQKLTQVVKLNHSWDEQYHLMEGALKVEIEKMQGQLAERKAEDERKEREREEMVKAAKLETEKAKAETSALQVQLDKTTRQLNKMKGYANSLQEHKQDLEAEVKRLNEALEQKLKAKEKATAPAPCPAHGVCKAESQAKPRRSNKETQLMSLEERSILESMSHDALIEELGLLKQQADIYKSDFFKEQRDRQRAMGELDEVRTELHRTKKKMEKQKHELQVIKDEALAYKYHTKERKSDRPAAVPRQPKTVKKQERAPGVYMEMNGHRPQHYYQKLYKPRNTEELVPHGGVNYAMNDEYIDAPDNFQVFYPPASDLSDGLQSGEPLREDDPFYHEIP